MRTLEEQARERREKLDKRHGVASNVKKIARVMWWSGFIGAITIIPAALWYTGKADKWLEMVEQESVHLSAEFGMTVKNIEVSGREKTDTNALLAAIGQKPGTPIITFDVEAARERVEELSWVRSAKVERQLPDTLIVSIVERKPLALWQTEGRDHVLIDGDGEQLQNYELGDYLDLPVLVGDDAPKAAAEMLTTLQTIPHLYDQITGAQRIGHRRWNIQLANGMFIRLPEENMELAWQRLEMLDREHGILDRDVLIVDLRLPDRTFVRLTPGAAEQRRNPPKKEGAV
ncbi:MULTISPECIES: cell division protein FtsQ/DivIB [Thalassospira]|uniref:Cell division protein FtsQ n=1 Tax=Thalassospira profundimaris TaxID=502049 RepID=A0A367VKF2_9PROT|nr:MULTISPECIES: FtsQ-type POTRA domain-containing protein [Thalassospira]KZB70708.1 cell division protein FtsQ [Thalassospira sp. MCCC 1A01148]MBR9899607.1 FtsQ-type POTRA domain-containing protein [Rhodospirillales bacterium]RCK25663.1 cell division protein FtsQ [Thalassospira profundimaris]